MACFVVPAAEAVVTTVIEKRLEKREREKTPFETGSSGLDNKRCVKKFSRKLKWLNSMLWGGSALLAFEHLWHGEIVPYFPFLTAMRNPADMNEMLHEMATNGVMMALLITVVWGLMVVISGTHEKKENLEVK